MPEPNVMPAGSALPEKKEDNAGASAGKDEKILGKFDTTEDLAAGYTQLETLLDKQGKEVGDLRTQNSELTKSATPKKEDVEELSFDDKQKEILDKIDKGELELATGLAQLTQVTTEAAEHRMETKFAAHDSNREAQELYDDFVEDNPLFKELDSTGKLDEVIATNPMHDKFSAFWALKAELDANAAYTKGQEETLKISKGADGVRTVLSGPGSQSREAPVPKKGMSQGEQAGGMLTALQHSRT